MALGAFGRDVRREYGLTGEQLAMLRIVGEQESWRMEELRGRLVMHPATLGQAVDRLAGRGLVLVEPDPSDGRRRNVAATDAGRELLAGIPLAGPVRLRAVDADPDRLARLADAFDDAVELFGLEKWA
ncbi:MarR family transcriptional regulator [Kribbella sp. NPDC049227]|uniref:MarR family transcriptional regulator n=1 Tax=Kribbella sp. NPDC049227 TaxID=3364113 RepID=UPI0037173458